MTTEPTAKEVVDELLDTINSMSPDAREEFFRRRTVMRNLLKSSFPKG